MIDTNDIDCKEDLRVIRTRKLLSNALFELLQTKKFDELSVLDICEKAMVHRATFYNHFEDKSHLLEFCLEDLQEELFNKTVNQKKYSSAKEMYLNLISNIFDYVEENKEKIYKIMEYNNIDKMKNLINNFLITSVRYLISHNEFNDTYTLPQKVIVDFLVGGLSNIGFSWILSKEKETKETLLGYVGILLNENTYIKR